MIARRPRDARGFVSTAAALATLGLVACSGGDDKNLSSDASAVLADDGGVEARWGEDAAFDDEDDERADAGGMDAATADSDAASEFDADLVDDGGSDMDARLADADTGDANVDDANLGDANQPDSDPCAVEGACAPHPLAGRYAVRTQIYARQQAALEDSPLDIVSKGVLISVADIDTRGVVNEHYCYLEINNDLGVTSWASPTTFSRVPDTHVALKQVAGRYLRPLADHHADLGWSATKTAPGCTPGATSSTGCHCAENGDLPTRADDCRVEDTDNDGIPGATLSVDVGSPDDPTTVSGLLALSVVARFNLEWSLPTTAGATLEGSLRGGLTQTELSRTGELATQFGALLNSICPNDTSRVELVRGDFTCASLLAQRATDSATFGTFDVTLDAPAPELEVCPDPSATSACDLDTDRDGTPDCRDDCPKDARKTAVGACGCGVADTNSDGDSAPDCADGCPGNPAKVLAGACGCDVADTDSDSDLVPDCNDRCPRDPAKTEVGACGCGFADTNTDNDSQPDCRDRCIRDPLKVDPGVCGCGIADTDSDRDGTPNCDDACPDDPRKNTLGLCGCGVAETNTDGDSRPDCTDACPNDATKIEVGACGCGIADTDTDRDGRPDCTDACPNDATKIAIGTCGCGIADTDTDRDGKADCVDECPNDSTKTTVGACGCGVADTNTDDDAQPDCRDGCIRDPLKTAPGLCGCGIADTNSDGDSQPDCNDKCEADPKKLAPGVCGCGIADIDLNGDGSIDCTDACPNDPAKVAPGLCGCGIADTNSDGDSQPDCFDGCANDPAKLAPGQCGCSAAETDSDADGVANCNDACPNDPLKAVLGVCGCSVADTDSDRDGTADCVDGCASDPAKTEVGACGCGFADTDSDRDGRADCVDACPSDPGKIALGVCGCGVADTDTDRDGTADCNETCDADPAKLAPGLCGCGVADTDTDRDGSPDCIDECDNNPALTVQGRCGCSACPPNPLAGRYAMRSNIYAKQRNNDAITGSKALNYSLIEITEAADGKLTLSERPCWTQTLPDPSDAGQKVYSWSKPANVQATPLQVQPLVANANGTYTRTIPLTHVGWDPARQPGACSATSTPVQPWNNAWGTTCLCNAPAGSLPPYDTNNSGFDCRLTDADADGSPGVTAIVSTAAPARPDSDPPGLPSASARAYGVADSSGVWTFTPGANGRHSAIIGDTGVGSLVGCNGLACLGLGTTPPLSRSCPAAFNKAQLVPVTADYDTCAEIIALKDSASLFVQTQDGDYPTTAACPAP